MPYGTVTKHGTMFVGFSADQKRLADMLDSMAGLGDGGRRDALTRYTHPTTGAYYFVPASDSVRRFVADDAGGRIVRRRAPSLASTPCRSRPRPLGASS